MARWLEQRPEVQRVLHPALESHPGHAIWKRDFTGASGLFSIVLKPKPQKAVDAMLNRLKLFGMGFSWGGFESLAIPFDCDELSHRDHMGAGRTDPAAAYRTRECRRPQGRSRSRLRCPQRGIEPAHKATRTRANVNRATLTARSANKTFDPQPFGDSLTLRLQSGSARSWEALVLLDLMGGVALLLWGLHMVHSGILRAFGPDLRRLLAKALGNRFAAFAAGLGLTALLQSSTATALITTSFAAEGLVGLVPALAIMLGANVGTTLIVQVLSFNIAAVAPVLFVVGLVAFRSGPRSRIKDLGRVLIGLGLMLLALHILLDTLAPAENAPGVRVLMDAITGDPVLCILIAARLTWAAHSSVATVLLIMSLAYSHFISPARRWRWCSAPISAAPSIRCSKARSATIPRATACRSAISSTASSASLLVLPFLRPIADLPARAGSPTSRR